MNAERGEGGRGNGSFPVAESSESASVENRGVFKIKVRSPNTPPALLRGYGRAVFIPRLIIPTVAAVFVLVFFSIHALWWRAPSRFPVGISVSIKEGMTLGEASLLLDRMEIVRSAFWFKIWSTLLGGDRGLKAGEYYLSVPASVFQLAKRFTQGTLDMVSVRVTVPEGLSNAKIADILRVSLPRFNRERFLKLTAKKEGYLFPDTYVFSPNIKEEKIIAEMEQNFENRTLPLQEKINDFGKPLHDVLTIASLIEGEVRTTESRKQVSGILWKRLALGMPLQVDAVFPYILGKNTFELTSDDLKIDSPYNTYLYAGLPPGPINNPSLDAISAAITPTSSEYLYYLTDKEGLLHYAKTHEQHLVNRAKYLGK